MEEEMQDLKAKKKVFSTLGWCYIAGTVAVYILKNILVYFVFAAKPEWQENTNISLLLSCVITYGCGMPLIVLLARRLPAKEPEKHTMKWWQFLLAFIICYAMVYTSNFVGIILTAIIGLVKGAPVQNGLLNVVTDTNLLVSFLAMVILAPMVEEYVFRKVIVDRTLQYGQWMAIASSAVMFGLFHGNLNQFVYALVLGGFFAFIYIKTGKLKITIAMHAIVNFFGGVIAPILLKMLDFDALQDLDPTDEAALMNMIVDNIGAWLIFMLYALVLFAIVITGIILFIVFFRRFKLDAGPDDVPVGKRFRTLFGNPGMLVFCLVWVVLIVLQLFE